MKQLKHCLAFAIREIKHSATRLMFYFTYSTRGNALTYTHTHIYVYVHTYIHIRSYVLGLCNNLDKSIIEIISSLW